MPVLRRYLHCIAILLLAIFAPFLAIAVYVAERLRTRRRRAVSIPVQGGNVVAFAPRLPDERRSRELPVNGGGVVLAFHPRVASAMTGEAPPALTGSR